MISMGNELALFLMLQIIVVNFNTLTPVNLQNRKPILD